MLHINDYNIRLNRNRHGGGVALYIKHILHYKVIHIGSSECECLTFTVTIGSCKFCVCVVYRPP